MADDIPDDWDVIIDSVTDIINILAERATPIQALEILSASTAFILCNTMGSFDSADRARSVFVHNLGVAVDKAEEIGATTWTRGTTH